MEEILYGGNGRKMIKLDEIEFDSDTLSEDLMDEIYSSIRIFLLQRDTNDWDKFTFRVTVEVLGV